MMVNNKNFVVRGVNFRKTSLNLRSKFALTSDLISEIYQDAASINQQDFFILSTCNRTEIYSFSESPEQHSDLFTRYNNISKEELDECVFTKSGEEAVQHLFRVAAGMDSQILGDYEIIGQLKNAFSLAKSSGMTSGVMEKLVNAAMSASRQVKARTALSDGTTSVSYSVIQLLKREEMIKSPARICLIGLGKIGTLTLKNLKFHLPDHEVILVNRNEEKARELASQYAVTHVEMENQQNAISKSDILIVATGADKAIVSAKDLANTNVRLVFDLSVPCNVSADVSSLTGIKLFNIDQLSEYINQTMENRKSHLPLAEEILEEHIDEFREWKKRRALYTAESNTVPVTR